MANLDAGLEAARSAPPDGNYLEDLFRARYLEMVRLAGLLGADDPEDIAQEAFTRMMDQGDRERVRGHRPAGPAGGGHRAGDVDGRGAA